MHQVIQLIYILAIMIGVIPFAMQAMITLKNLDVTNEMVKSKSTSVFLALIVVFNLFDFLVIFLGDEISDASIAWIFVIQNVLEVAMAYALIAMERDYAGASPSRWLPIFFAVIATAILWTDTLYTARILWMSEEVYAVLMVILNLLPVLVTGYFCIKYIGIIFKETTSRLVDFYLIIYNMVFVFLCAVATVCMIDSRTAWDYVRNDKEMYVIFWLAFNALNAFFILYSCRLVSEKAPEVKETIEDRVERLAHEFNLSTRETEIAWLLYEGKNNQEMADELFLSTNTIKVHASNLYRKLGVTNRVQAVKILRGDDR